MARAPSSSSLLLVLLVAAAAAATLDGAPGSAAGNLTEELRWAARRARRGWRRKAFENGLGRTPQMG
jgi:alpha-galactosidase